ncbi:protein kinase superfamily protein [Abortiporus biennis]
MSSAIAHANLIQSFDEYSQPLSQASSPASPTASFQNQQIQISLPTVNLNGSSRSEGSTQPGTPIVSPNSSPLEPPSGMSYSDFLRTWTDNHVARWLTEIKCGQHSQTFKANDIRGDVLLELDQSTLKEMGMRCSVSSNSALASIGNRPRPTGRNGSVDYGTGRTGYRRLDNARPAPLSLPPGPGNNELPRLVRDTPDSARSNSRPLPQPTSSSHTPSPPTHTPSSRGNLPPLPPPPKVQPPPPPGSRTPRSLLPPQNSLSGRRTPTLPDAPAYTNQPLPPAPNQTHLTPSSHSQNGNWPSGGARTPLRSPSPLQPQSSGAIRNIKGSPNGSQAHGRNGSYPTPLNSTQPNIANKLPPRPNTSGTSHPTPPPGSNQYRAGLRPNTPSRIPSIDDLKRKLIKFALPDEGKTITINAVDIAGGAEILEKVLKKFGKLGHRSSDDGSLNVEVINGGLCVDGWAAYLEWNPGDSTGGPLTEAQLLAICHAPPDDPARDHGLTLRRLGVASRGDGASSSTENLGDALLNIESARSPSQPTTKAMKRASTVSILSGLGVPIPDSAPQLLSPDRSPTKSPVKKLRNFFGQRPPSELITNHLAEYFPNTEKKVLERTRRQSMMRVAGKRDSIVSWNPPPRSRFSVSTQGSASALIASPRSSIISAHSMLPERQVSPVLPEEEPTEAPPRVSISNEEGRAIEVTDDVEEKSTKAAKRRSALQFLPPVAISSESLADSLNLTDKSTRRASKAMSIASNRMSYITELRSKRDRSDTASMMTVDEITAEVENRRASMETDSKRASMILSNSDGTEEWTTVDVEESDEKTTLLDDTTELDEDEELDEVEDEDEDEDEEEESGTEETVTEDEDEDQGKQYTSHGERTIKWIKGALIGAGSFGKVYLGMDAASGLLMAVKQVELPRSSAPNPERKQAMLSALEREIELLKDLHHENIVQYHSSCIDEDHLNIFLEYVPGGSVTSLLRNYGAFEEQLVRNWVRQILSGLNYLHEKDIIHRDIKGANMLVDNKGGIKISDFGISKKVEDNLLPGHRAHRPSLQGSVFWMAPEVVKQTAYTQAADIWSIGCLVVEMLTGEHPWAQLTQMQAIFKIGSSARPTIPPDISPEAEDFLNKTFDLDHEARPTAAELLKHPWIVGASTP